MANKNTQCFFKIKVVRKWSQQVKATPWKKDRDLGMRWRNSWVSLKAYAGDSGQAGAGGRDRVLI